MATEYEYWGTSSGRGGIQRTLDPADADDNAFLADGMRIVNGDGSTRTLTIEEANAMGVRRCVAAKDIHTGEMRLSGTRSKTPFFVVKGN